MQNNQLPTKISIESKDNSKVLHVWTCWANDMCLGCGGRFWSNATIAVQQQTMCLGCQPWLVERAFDKLFPSSGQPSLTSTELAMDHCLSADQCQQFFLTKSKQRHSADRDVGDSSWSGSPFLLVSNLISLLVSEGADRCRHLFALLSSQETMDQVPRSGRTLGRTDDRDKCVAFEEISCHLKIFSHAKWQLRSVGIRWRPLL